MSKIKINNVLDTYHFLPLQNITTVEAKDADTSKEYEVVYSEPHCSDFRMGTYIQMVTNDMFPCGSGGL